MDTFVEQIVLKKKDAKQITVMLPDENTRRVGQSVAAASLPDIG